MSTPAGRFVWFEIMSTDVERAVSFYGELFGWTIKTSDQAGMDYRMAFAGDHGVVGFMSLDPDLGQPSHWIGYATVPDVDAAVKAASRAGAAVPVEPMDIEGVGRFAILIDAQGAAIAPFRAEGDVPPELEPPPPGMVCWCQYNAQDAAAAADFYRGLFDWTITETPMAGDTSYWMVTRADGREVGGMTPIPDGVDAPAHWLYYVGVTDVDETVRRTSELGGSVHVPPTDIPRMGRFAVLGDPTGGPFAVYAAV
jgi:hypothetical protein